MKVSSPGTAKQYRGHASIFATRPAVAETSDKSSYLAPSGINSLCRAFCSDAACELTRKNAGRLLSESRKLLTSPTLTTPESSLTLRDLHYEHLSSQAGAPRMERCSAKCTCRRRRPQAAVAVSLTVRWCAVPSGAE